MWCWMFGKENAQACLSVLQDSLRTVSERGKTVFAQKSQSGAFCSSLSRFKIPWARVQFFHSQCGEALCKFYLDVFLLPSYLPLFFWQRQRQSGQPKKQLWCFSNMEESWDFNLETNELNFSVLFQSEGFALKKGKSEGTFLHHASFPTFALFYWKTE